MSAAARSTFQVHPSNTFDLFRSGDGGYHTFRIPALAVTRGGAVLAFAEGRRKSVSDTGLIEIVLRRSVDGGRTFGASTVVIAQEGMTCGNPTPTVDTETGTILLPFCKNPEDGPEPLVFEGKASRTAWITRSNDDGLTWETPIDITASAKPANTSWFAFGPGHGTRLASGRLVVPSVHAAIVDRRHSDPCRAQVTLSDDGGVTFRVGGIIDVPTSSECEVVELGPNELYLNARYEAKDAGRISAWSDDGGESFYDVTIDRAQTDATCQGSMARAVDGRIVLVNALGPRRERLAARVSDDRGRHFGEPFLLDERRAAYSDLVALPDGGFLCAYECGVRSAYEKITCVRFDLK
jgi:sialidase-1